MTVYTTRKVQILSDKNFGGTGEMVDMVEISIDGFASGLASSQEQADKFISQKKEEEV